MYDTYDYQCYDMKYVFWKRKKTCFQINLDDKIIFIININIIDDYKSS
jgi:hypothetical protein